MDSSNYDPQPLWNAGCQVVALNYQTPDRFMWINHGKFKANAACGYIVKPAVQLDYKAAFDPFVAASWLKFVKPLSVKLRIISGRHLVKPGKGTLSPFVAVGVTGVEIDSVANERRTKMVKFNGFRPVWDEEMTLEISMPELACIVFTVFDEDQFGDSNAVGQAVLPIGTEKLPILQEGYRSVQLMNIYSQPLEMASILIHIDLSYGQTKQSKQTQKIRTELQAKQEERTQLARERVEAAVGGGDAITQKQYDAKMQKLTKEILALEKKDMALSK